MKEMTRLDLADANIASVCDFNPGLSEFHKAVKRIVSLLAKLGGIGRLGTSL